MAETMKTLYKGRSSNPWVVKEVSRPGTMSSFFSLTEGVSMVNIAGGKHSEMTPRKVNGWVLQGVRK
jgi:hypothetical protein